MFDAQFHESTRVSTSSAMTNAESFDPRLVLFVGDDGGFVSLSNKTTAQSDIRPCESAYLKILGYYELDRVKLIDALTEHRLDFQSSSRQNVGSSFLAVNP